MATTGTKAKTKKTLVIKKSKSVIKKTISTAVKKSVKKPVLKTVARIPLKKIKKAAGKKTLIATKLKSKTPLKKIIAKAKNKTESSVQGITIPEILKQAEELHMIPVESIVHPITIEENKKLETQYHRREDGMMQQENMKMKNALASGKGNRTGFRPRRRS